jgi:hypothetical protein
MKNDKHNANTDSSDPLHSPKSIEAAPSRPCTDRSARVAAAFPIRKADEGSTSLEPIETLDLIDGCVNWRPADHRNALKSTKHSKRVRNHD